VSELQALREEKDALFANHPQSPLTPEQRRSFRGLKYFPEEPALRFEVDVDEFPTKEAIDMQTSTGDVQAYERFGQIKFSVGGQEAALTIYRSENGYFLPFVDALAGKDTYPAGRYLEPESLPDGRFLIDFNQAYNPYCAYNELWSCPITPVENRLQVPIRAGEKLFSSKVT